MISNEMKELVKKVSLSLDTRIYRVMSGKFKLTKYGELDMRFNENKRIVEEERADNPEYTNS